MTDANREERIRERAHALWEQEGRPFGRHDAHWEQARRELGADDPAETSPPDVANDAAGLAAGVLPVGEAEPRHPVEPPEGDRETIERKPARTAKPRRTPARARKD